MTATKQMTLYPSDRPRQRNTELTSTFRDNVTLPIHRWFRYSAGFSALWVRELIEKQKRKGKRRILDPFAGSGTVLLEGESANVEAVGIEAHPFVARIARTKLFWRERPKQFREHALNILCEAKKLKPKERTHGRLVEKCFPREYLLRLEALRQAWEIAADGSPCAELTWLALVSVLRACSPVGTAQWQYILPKKSKAKVLEPYSAFEAKVFLMSGDMEMRQKQDHGPGAKLYWEDARSCDSLPDGWADLIITSPPYANNYDYADATRLEMTFLGQVKGWGELQDAVRKYLVRSCTQHVCSLNGQTYTLIRDPILEPIHKELFTTCRQLEREREKHGGKKAYHTMIAAYFLDMAKAWVALRRVSSTGSLVCCVVGDSAPYGIYVPVDKWLGQLALAAGFRSCFFEKTRDRNIKWKNRKHRIPLHEGRMWVEG